jgi:hypothetical protein
LYLLGLYVLLNQTPTWQSAAKVYSLWTDETPDSFIYYTLKSLAEQIMCMPFSFIAFKQVMKCRFKDFSLTVIQINSNNGSANPSSFWPINPIFRFWLTWWLLSIIIICPTEALLDKMLSPYNGCAILLDLIAVTTIDIAILKKLSYHRFSDFRIALISRT